MRISGVMRAMLCVCVCAAGAWGASFSSPARGVRHERDRITIELAPGVPEAARVKAPDGSVYTALVCPGYGAKAPAGAPALPVIDVTVPVPRRTPLPAVRLRDCRWGTLALDAPVIPAQHPRAKRGGGSPPFARDARHYAGRGFRNARAIGRGTWYELSSFRRNGVDYVHLELFLYGFDPAGRRVRFPRHLTVELTWHEGAASRKAGGVRRTEPVEVLAVDGVTDAWVGALAARGFDIDARQGERLIIYATAAEKGELLDEGFAVKVLPNEAPRKALALKGRGDHALGDYHSHETLTTFLEELAGGYPDLCRLGSIGSSEEGRALWALRIAGNADERAAQPVVRLVGAMHGDEPVGMELLLYFAAHLLGEYGGDARVTGILDGMALWILPLLNPDGLARGTRYNALGADLNRSFPDRITDPVNSPDGRDAEVRAMMAFLAQHRTAAAANFHGGALVVNYPFDSNESGLPVYTATPDDALFIGISSAYAGANPRMAASAVFPGGITNGARWYVIHGGLQDYSYVWHATHEVTVEISEQKWPPAERLPELWDENRDALLAYVESVFTAAAGRVLDAATGEPVAGAHVVVAGNAQAVGADGATGYYHRMLPPGTYSLTFWAPGYVPRTEAGVTVVAGETTLLDVTLSAQQEPVLGPVLVVAGEALESAAEALAQYYEALGHGAATLVVRGVPAAGEIRDAIRTVWTETACEYVVLVGDVDTIPAFVRDGHVSDLLYSLLDPGESWGDVQGRDVFVGRIPARTEGEVAATIERLQRFRAGRRDQRFAWIAQGNSGAECAVAEATHAWVVANLCAEDARHDFFFCGQGAAGDFFAALADGVDVVTYSGHGHWDRWVRWSLDVHALANVAARESPPLVLSYACDTGRFEYDRCLGEAWMLGEDRAAAFVGASDSTYWDEDDILEREQFRLLLGGDGATLGAALYGGLDKVARHSAKGQFYHEVYHVLGDPTLSLTSGVALLAVAWDDGGNGIVEAGETAELALTVFNRSGRALEGVEALLSAESAHVSPPADPLAVGVLDAARETVLRFTVSIAADCPSGHAAPAVLTLAHAAGSVSLVFELRVHLVSDIAGTVRFEENGAFAPDVRVRVIGAGGDHETFTDAWGRFAFALIEGDYVLRAWTDGYYPEEREVTLPPGVAHLDLALGWAQAVPAPPRLDLVVGPLGGHVATVSLSNPGTRALAYDVVFDADRTAPGGGYRARSAGDVEADGIAWMAMDDGDVLAVGSADDEVWGPVTLPFAFRFFGGEYHEIHVCSNGFLAFAAPGDPHYVNRPLPSALAPPLCIAPLWDDLVVEQDGAVAVLAGADVWAVEFRGMRRYGGQARFAFQAQLFRDGRIAFVYQDMPWEELAGATIGVQDASGTLGLQVGPQDVRDGVLVFWDRPEWIAAAPAAGHVPAGGAVALAFTVPVGVPEGVYTTRALIRSDSPRAPQAQIAVTAAVHADPGWHFLRGDANADGVLDLADAVAALGYLFAGVNVGCAAALDVNADGMVDIADHIAVLTYLFAGGAAPRAPFPACGFVPRVSGLACDVEQCAP